MEQKYAVGEAFTKRTVQDLKAGDPKRADSYYAGSQHLHFSVE